MRYLCPTFSLALARHRSASLSLPPGCSLGSLSSPVRASNPSWTKVLPAPSHIGRTFPHSDARRSWRSLHRIRDRSSRFRFLRTSRCRNVGHATDRLTWVDLGRLVWCMFNGGVRRRKETFVIDKVDWRKRGNRIFADAAAESAMIEDNRA